MTYKVKDFLAWLDAVYQNRDKTVYVLGGIGTEWTSTLAKTKYNQSGGVGAYNTSRKDKLDKLLDKGYIAYDCVCMYKSFMFSKGGTESVSYDSNYDWNETMIYDKATTKGAIATIPEVPGLGLIMSNHFGVYLGNGIVQEVTPSTTYATQSHGCGGITRTKLSDRQWSKWCYLSDIDYSANTLPLGCLDGILCNDHNSITLAGWAFDRDNQDKAIDIHIYVGDTLVGYLSANQTRDDVNKAYNITGKHGFSGTLTVPDALVGEQTVKVYAIDTDDINEHTKLAERTVDIISNHLVGDTINVIRAYKACDSTTPIQYAQTYECKITDILSNEYRSDIVNKYVIKFSDECTRFCRDEDIK